MSEFIVTTSLREAEAEAPTSRRHRLGEDLVVGHPRVLPREMRLDGEPLPLFQLLVDVPASSFGEEPQRIAGEINLFLAVVAHRNVEFVSEPPERVASIQGDREVASGLERLAHRLSASRTKPPGGKVKPLD